MTPEPCGVGTGWAPASGAAKKPWGKGWGHPRDGDKRCPRLAWHGKAVPPRHQGHLPVRVTGAHCPPSLPGRLPCTIRHPDLHYWFPPCCPCVPTSLGLPGWVLWENYPAPQMAHLGAGTRTTVVPRFPQGSSVTGVSQGWG